MSKPEKHKPDWKNTVGDPEADTDFYQDFGSKPERRERPRKVKHTDCCDTQDQESLTRDVCDCGADCWNACIDAYEEWEPSEDELIALIKDDVILYDHLQMDDYAVKEVVHTIHKRIKGE